MPAAIWSGTLTFGLVAIPVQMRSAVTSHKISFRQIHLEDGGRVRYRKTCEVDGQVLTEGEIGRAYEVGKDHLVALSDDELDALPLPTAKTIEVGGFIDVSAVPPEMIGKPYFLAPSSPAANKPYVLMRRALERSGKAAVGKVAMRGTGERLILVRPRGDILVVLDLHWPDELREPGDAAPGPADISDDELAGALGLIEALGDVDMAEMQDQYAEAMQSLIDAKIQHKPAPPAREPERVEAGVTDLMAALEAATKQARADRGKSADVHDLDSRRTAKKTVAKKTTKKAPAKKATKKTTAKKTTTRKRTG